MKIFKHSFLVLSLTFFSACTIAPKSIEKVEVQEDEIVLMTYNVENLFDTEDDPGKNDEEYLPRSVKKSPYYQNLCFTKATPYFRDECLGKDWSEKIFKRKVQRLARVISSFNHGRGPDVLVLEEVENINALNALAQAMPHLNFTTVVLLEGPDERGIDVGVLSRLPRKSAQLHTIDFEEIKFSLESKEKLVKARKTAAAEPPVFALAKEDVEDIKDNYHTRGILEVELQLPDGKSLFILGGHFPSQRSPTGYRRAALEKLSQIKNSLPKDALVIAAGDFNISASEEIKNKLYAEQAARDWAISHEIGCKTCLGTYYYHRKREWSFFDAFFFDKSMLSEDAKWKVDPDSIAVYNDDLYQINRFGSPARFDKGRQGVGVSDHWPLVAKIKRNHNEQKLSANESLKKEEESDEQN